MNRDPIGEWGGLNLFSFVRNAPVTFVDFLGWTKWNVQDTQKLLDIASKEGLIDGLINHSGFSTFDFKMNQPGDTFDIAGYFGIQTLKADEFGNYIAGYGGTYAFGELGYMGVVAGGIWYDAVDSSRNRRVSDRDRGSFDWDADSRPAIDAGHVRAELERNPRDPYADANSTRNCVRTVTSKYIDR